MTEKQPTVYKKIESPISAFNNILIQITKDLEQIYIGNCKCNRAFINGLIFKEKSITIANRIILSLNNNGLSYRFCGEFDNEKLELITKTIKHQKELGSILQHYLFMLNSITNNLDMGISHKYLEDIEHQIITNKIDAGKMFLIPIKTKIKHLYDYNDKTLDKLFNRYSYVVKFNVFGANSFTYKIVRVLSSELDESKSLENIRFEEIEVVKEDSLKLNQLQPFLVNLFYYGEIKN